MTTLWGELLQAAAPMSETVTDTPPLSGVLVLCGLTVLAALALFRVLMARLGS